MVFEASGSKREMHKWQHQAIRDYRSKQLDVADAYRASRTRIENDVNTDLEATVHFSSPIQKWAFIAIIRANEDPAYKEVWTYCRKRQVIEFRLKIDYEAFKSAGAKQQDLFVYEALWRSVEIMPHLSVSETTWRVLRSIIKRRIDLNIAGQP